MEFFILTLRSRGDHFNFFLNLFVVFFEVSEVLVGLSDDIDFFVGVEVHGVRFVFVCFLGRLQVRVLLCGFNHEVLQHVRVTSNTLGVSGRGVFARVLVGCYGGGVNLVDIRQGLV